MKFRTRIMLENLNIRCRTRPAVAALCVVTIFIIYQHYSNYEGPVTCQVPTMYIENERNMTEHYAPAALAALDCVEASHKPNRAMVKTLAVLMRILTQIRTDLLAWQNKSKDLQDASTRTRLLRRLQQVELRVYPFLNGKFKTVDEWQASYSGRGIVMSVAAKHMRYVIYLLKNLKAVGCTLPVEIVTEDAKQLSNEYKTMLASFNVRLVYVAELMDNKVAQISSYGMKLAAMFVSSFREAILIDCDDVFLRNPELLFDDEGYKSTGTLLFFDQPERVGTFEHRDWLIEHLPQPLSERVLKSNMFKGHDREVDSAVVVMDKVRCFYGLLAATRLNMGLVSQVLYPIFYGDAELWWIGFEMVRVAYSISPFPAGSIGPVNGNEVCGKNMHVGNDGRPFFWNQGFVDIKGKSSNVLLDFKAFTKTGIVFLDLPFFCVKGPGPIKLNDKELETIDKLEILWQETKDFPIW